MAKINSGTITADGAGIWTSEAITLTSGAKRVYLRVGGTEVLYRDFTVGAAASVSVAAGPWSVEANPASGVALPCTITSTAGASLLVAMVCGNNSGGLGTSSSMASSGLTWTKASGAFVAGGGTGEWGGPVEVWYAYSTGALSNHVVNWSSTAFGCRTLMSIVSLSGHAASNPIGNVSTASLAMATNGARTQTITCSAGSMIFGAAFFGPESTSNAPTAGTGTTLLYGGSNRGMLYRSTNATSAGSNSVAISSNATATGTWAVAVEVLAG
jgi:hypothetical protein